MRLFALLGALLLSGTAHANGTKLQIYPVVVESTNGRGSFTIVNLSDTPVTLEANLQQDGQTQKRGMVFPPVRELPPGSKQMFRLVLPVVNAGEAAQKYRAIVKEVKPKALDDAASGIVQELSFELPVFVVAKDATVELRREGDKVKNVGTRHVLITHIDEQRVHEWLMPGDAIEAPAGAVLKSYDKVLEVK